MSGPEGTTVASLAESAAHIVSLLLGARVRSSELLRQGLMTFKCRVRTEAGDDVIVRFYPSGRRTVVNQEPDLLERCRRIGLPVPGSIGDSRTGPSSPLAYVAYRRIPGTTLAEALAAGNESLHGPMAESLSSHLAHLPEIEFTGAGELATSTAANDASWEVFVEAAIRSGLDAIERHALLDAALLEEIKQVTRTRMPASRRTKHSLVWGDINFGNILVGEDGHITGLIDFESCLSGDPLATLGYAHAAHGSHPFFAQLLRVWPQPLSASDHDFIAFYSILRTLRLAPYAHLPLPTGRLRDPLVDIFPGIVPALRHFTQQRPSIMRNA